MGGWLTKRLLAEGAHVIALVRHQPRGLFLTEGCPERCVVVYGSLGDLNLLRRTVCEYEVDTVFHLAAQALAGAARKDPVGTLETNVQGTWHLLESARGTGVKQIIIASSDKAYGDSDSLPYLEDQPLEGRLPYDVSKSCADLISAMYAATYGLPVAVVRCANLYGGGDFNFDRVIPGVIQATLRGERFAIRSDGLFIRDFLYVEDAAVGCMAVAQGLAGDRSLIGEAFNLGLGTRLTVLDVADSVLRLMGRQDLEPLILNQANAEIRARYMSCDKARKCLGWKPGYTFEEGLRETIEWYRAHLAVPVARPSDPRFTNITVQLDDRSTSR